MLVLDQVRSPGHLISRQQALNSFPTLHNFISSHKCISYYSDTYDFIFIQTEKFFYKFFRPHCFELAHHSLKLDIFINESVALVSSYCDLMLIRLPVYEPVSGLIPFNILITRYDDLCSKLNRYAFHERAFSKVIRTNEDYLYRSVFYRYLEDIRKLLNYSGIEKMINDLTSFFVCYAHNDFHNGNLLCSNDLIICDFEMVFLHRSSKILDFVNFSRSRDEEFRSSLMNYFDLTPTKYEYIQRLLALKNLFILEYLEYSRGWDVLNERSKFLGYF